MPYRPAAIRTRAGRPWLAIALIAAVAPLAGHANADGPAPFEPPRFLRDDQPPAAGQLAPVAAVSTPFQPANVTTRLRRSLMQFQALAADEAWDEALDLAEQLRRDQGGSLAPLDALGLAPSGEAGDGFGAGFALHVPVHRLCAQLLRSLPAEGQAVYRGRHAVAAQRRLEEAISKLDESAAWRVANEWPLTDGARESLLAASELALERGDYAAARRGLHAAHPMARDPLGRPAATAMARINPEASSAELGEAWTDGDPSQADRVLATVLARLTLTSMREGDLRRAEVEHRLLAAACGDAPGRIAGEVRPLASTLGEMLSDARGSSAPRGDTNADAGIADSLRWAWPQATQIASEVATPNRPNVFWRQNALQQRLLLGAGRPIRTPTLLSRQGPSSVPIAIAGDAAFYCQGGDLMRLELLSGQTRPGPSLVDEQPAKSQAETQPDLGDLAAGDGAGGGVALDRRLLAQRAPVFGQGIINRRGAVGRLVASEPASLGDLLLVRVNDLGRERLRRPGRAQPSSETLVALAAGESLALVRRFTVTPSEGIGDGGNSADFGFAGAPARIGDRLLLPVERRSTRRTTALVCVSAIDGRAMWRTELGAAQRQNATQASVLVAGDTAYTLTGDGGLAAINVATGAIRWLITHPRVATPPRGFARHPDRLAVFGDHVLLAPGNADELVAIDAATGELLWRRPLGDRAPSLLAVHLGPQGASVLVAGERVASYDVLTGERRFRWPDASKPGVRGLGRGVLVGDELFWPTRDAVYAVHPTTGAPTRPPIGLERIGSTGATLVPAGGGLLVCGAGRAQWLGPAESLDSQPRPEPPPRLSRFMEASHPTVAHSRLVAAPTVSTR